MREPLHTASVLSSELVVDVDSDAGSVMHAASSSAPTATNFSALFPMFTPTSARCVPRRAIATLRGTRARVVQARARLVVAKGDVNRAELLAHPAYQRRDVS